MSHWFEWLDDEPPIVARMPSSLENSQVCDRVVTDASSQSQNESVGAHGANNQLVKPSVILSIRGD